jgi:hypothetical protein
MVDSVIRPVWFLLISLGLNFPALWYGFRQGVPRTFGWGHSLACSAGTHWLVWNILLIVLHLSVAIYSIIKIHNKTLGNPLKDQGIDLDDDDESVYSEAREKVAPTSPYLASIDDGGSMKVTPTLSPNLSDSLEKGDPKLLGEEKEEGTYSVLDAIIYSVVTALWFLWQLYGGVRANELGEYQGGACTHVQQWIITILGCSAVYVIFLAYVSFRAACQCTTASHD